MKKILFLSIFISQLFISLTAQAVSIDLSVNQDEAIGESIPVTISVGVAHNTGENIEIDELILTADKYLYVAKEKGRNRVCAQEQSI